MVTGLLNVMTRATQRALERARVVTTTQLDMGLRDLRYKIERKIEMTAAAAENELFQALATRLGMMLAEAQSLRDSLAQKDAALTAAQEALASEQAGRNEEVARQVAEALELDAQRDAARLEELLRQAGGTVPAPVPPVEVPPAGEPAQPPTDVPVEVPPVNEGELPVTDPTTPSVDPVPSDPATEPGSAAGPGDVTDPGAAGEATPVAEGEQPTA